MVKHEPFSLINARLWANSSVGLRTLCTTLLSIGQLNVFWPVVDGQPPSGISMGPIGHHYPRPLQARASYHYTLELGK